MDVLVEYWPWVVVTTWVVASLLNGVIADEQGRSMGLAILASVLLSPAFAWAYLAAVGPRPRCGSCGRFLLEKHAGCPDGHGSAA